MNQQRYLDDSYVNTFEANVSQCTPTDGGAEVILRETWFYPESGGQPADHGSIGDANVLDVSLRGTDVIHTLDQPVEGALSARIDWERRYDHMQQHTGQHLLSAALILLRDASTLSFHLGADISTIDVDINGISKSLTREAEDLCSQWIAAALPVTMQYVSIKEFGDLHLRKKALPDHVEGPIRLIHVGDVDTAHCGGTHVRNTAELQLIKIIGSERVRDTVRINFLAGQRAILDYDRKHKLLKDMSDSLTCGIEELPHVVSKLQSDNKEMRSELRTTTKELASLRAAADSTAAEQHGRWQILVKRYDGMDPGALKNLASEMTSESPDLLFCGAGESNGKAAVVLAAGESFDGDLGVVIRELLPVINGKGGGRGNIAQGVGEPENIDELLQRASEALKNRE